MGFTIRSDRTRAIAEVFAYSVRGNVRYELSDADGAISDWSDASDIAIANGLERVTPQLPSLIYLKLAVAQYLQGDRQESLQTVKYIRWNQSLADLQYLKSKGWGERLLRDARTFFNSPQMQALLAKMR